MKQSVVVALIVTVVLAFMSLVSLASNKPIIAIGLESTFDVSMLLKGTPPGDGKKKERLVLHHYRLENPKLAESPMP